MGPDFEAFHGTLARCRLDGSERESMRVMRCRLDGSDLEVLVQRGQIPQDSADVPRHCVGFAVDNARGCIYWAQKGNDNAGEGRIIRAPIDLPEGATPETRDDIELLTEGLPEPIDLHLTRGGKTLFWTDRGAPQERNTLNRAAKTESGFGPVEILASGFKETIGLAVDEDAQKVWVSDLGGEVRLVNLETLEGAVIGKYGWLTGIALLRH
ncbi:MULTISPECIES: hypothetical protein [Salipiger]|uniref:hypothetical protein n=1 Tax=Salipiger TaxID=263377 RepID=UPI0035161014